MGVADAGASHRGVEEAVVDARANAMDGIPVAGHGE